MLGRSDGIEGFERHVVLKRTRPELARDQRFVRMFLDEARVAAALHHQHIVQVYDIGEANGEYFLTMEYVHGEDVRKILANAARQRTHVPLGYAIAIVSAAAAGLHYAHEQRGADKQPLDIVHRDVSPSNILVGYDGAVKVVDFGVASASMRQEVRSDSVKGKLSYMAPEQCRGMQVDRRADVYALGAVLYELVTTTRMIKGENDRAMVEQIVHGKIAPPQTRRPGLPATLSDIIMRALATDRDQRYATADDLRTALDQFAIRSALTASTSAIAAYMRQQFGQRPEPWLELDGRVIGPAEGAPAAPPPAPVSVAKGSWVEPPRSSVDPRAAASSISRQSDPLDPIGDGAAELAVRSAPRAPASRRIPVHKLAIGGGALVAGLVLWFLTGGGPAPAPTASAAALPATLAAPQAIASVGLEANRASGDKHIVPDAATMDAMTRSGTDTVAGSYQVCIGADGNITSVRLLQTSGFPAYDDKIQTTIRRDWRYRPFLVDGVPTAVCTAIRFVYVQK